MVYVCAIMVIVKGERNMLLWNELTEQEEEQAEISIISIYEDIANNGDVYDIADYEILKESRKFRIARLKTKTFTRDKNGYIFVNL